MSPIELCWNITSYISIIVQLIAAGVCFEYLYYPICRAEIKQLRRKCVWGVMTVLYIMPPQIDNILAYFIGTVAALP